MTVTCLVDSMIFDAIVDEPGMLDRIRAANDAGQLDLFATSVSERQIAAVPDPKRRALLQMVPVTYVGTAGFVLDYSRLDVDRLGPAEPIEAIAGGKQRELGDGLIAATAAWDGVPLVTLDRRLQNRTRRELSHVKIWSWEDLREVVLRMSPKPKPFENEQAD
jgi:hypothetical protein